MTVNSANRALRLCRADGGLVDTVGRHVGMGLAVADEYLPGQPLTALAGLSPFTSYGRVREAREAALDDFRRTYPRLARDVLSGAQNPANPKAAAEGILIGLPALWRYEKAGFRHPDDWGGSNRLAHAEAEYNKRRRDMELSGQTPAFDNRVPQDDLWTNFGAHMIDLKTTPARAGGSGPVTAIPNEDFRIKMTGGPAETYDLKTFIDHPHLAAAHPDLMKAPTTLHVNPNAPIDAWTRTSHRPGTAKSVDEFFVHAPDDNAAKSIMSHELTHGSLHVDGLPPGSNLTHSPMMTGVTTDVIDRWKPKLEQIDKLMQVYASIGDQQMLTQLADARTKVMQNLAQAYRFRDYLGEAGEEAARRAQRLARLPWSDVKKSPPDELDTYAMGDISKSFDYSMHRPRRAP